MRVLIVDDNLELAENIAEILGFAGYSAEVSGSGEEALTSGFVSGVDVVITDYRLPGMSGADLVRRIRQQREGIHAAVISAYSDEGTIAAVGQAGATFFAKPLDLSALSGFVRSALGTA